MNKNIQSANLVATTCGIASVKGSLESLCKGFLFITCSDNIVISKTRYQFHKINEVTDF